MFSSCDEYSYTTRIIMSYTALVLHLLICIYILAQQKKISKHPPFLVFNILSRGLNFRMPVKMYLRFVFTMLSRGLASCIYRVTSFVNYKAICVHSTIYILLFMIKWYWLILTTTHDSFKLFTISFWKRYVLSSDHN